MSEEKQHYWVDIESGVRFPCTKEYYEGMKKIWEDCKPKFNPSKKITSMLITGTAGENHFLREFYEVGIDPITSDKSSIGWIPIKAESEHNPDPSVFQKLISAMRVPTEYFGK